LRQTFFSRPLTLSFLGPFFRREQKRGDRALMPNCHLQMVAISFLKMNLFSLSLSLSLSASRAGHENCIKVFSLQLKSDRPFYLFWAWKIGRSASSALFLVRCDLAEWTFHFYSDLFDFFSNATSHSAKVHNPRYWQLIDNTTSGSVTVSFQLGRTCPLNRVTWLGKFSPGRFFAFGSFRSYLCILTKKVERLQFGQFFHNPFGHPAYELELPSITCGPPKK
jgi:hypothetical protein